MKEKCSGTENKAPRSSERRRGRSGCVKRTLEAQRRYRQWSVQGYTKGGRREHRTVVKACMIACRREGGRRGEALTQ